MKVSAIGFGAWAIGGNWGTVDDATSMAALHAAIDNGVNFIDTADVYGDGRSERLVARLRRERPGETIWVATKAGRRLPQQTCEGYSRENLTAWVDRSLHEPRSRRHRSPPAALPAIGALPTGGNLRASWTTWLPPASCATTASAFRRPTRRSTRCGTRTCRASRLSSTCSASSRRNGSCPKRLAKQVGILARVPLASGLLTGKLRPRHAFPPDDHRSLQPRRPGVRQGRNAVRACPMMSGSRRWTGLRDLVPHYATMAQFALQLDSDVRRRHVRDTRCAHAATGARQRPGRKHAAARAGHVIEAVRGVYDDLDQAARSRELVTHAVLSRLRQQHAIAHRYGHRSVAGHPPGGLPALHRLRPRSAAATRRPTA